MRRVLYGGLLVITVEKDPQHQAAKRSLSELT